MICQQLSGGLPPQRAKSETREQHSLLYHTIHITLFMDIPLTVLLYHITHVCMEVLYQTFHITRIRVNVFISKYLLLYCIWTNCINIHCCTYTYGGLYLLASTFIVIFRATITWYLPTWNCPKKALLL